MFQRKSHVLIIILKTKCGCLHEVYYAYLLTVNAHNDNLKITHLNNYFEQ